MMKIVIFSNQDLVTQHTYLGLRVSSPVISIHDFYFFYQDDGLKNIPDTPKCSRNAARRELKVLGISEFMCVCCGQTVYSENFRPSACHVPRTFMHMYICMYIYIYIYIYIYVYIYIDMRGG